MTQNRQRAKSRANCFSVKYAKLINPSFIYLQSFGPLWCFKQIVHNEETHRTTIFIMEKLIFERWFFKMSLQRNQRFTQKYLMLGKCKLGILGIILKLRHCSIRIGNKIPFHTLRAKGPIPMPSNILCLRIVPVVFKITGTPEIYSRKDIMHSLQ